MRRGRSTSGTPSWSRSVSASATPEPRSSSAARAVRRRGLRAAGRRADRDRAVVRPAVAARSGSPRRWPRPVATTCAAGCRPSVRTATSSTLTHRRDAGPHPRVAGRAAHARPGPAPRRPPARRRADRVDARARPRRRAVRARPGRAAALLGHLPPARSCITTAGPLPPAAASRRGSLARSSDGTVSRAGCDVTVDAVTDARRRPDAADRGARRRLRSLRGGAGRAEVGGVFGQWDEAVGEAIAAHVRPVRLDARRPRSSRSTTRRGRPRSGCSPTTCGRGCSTSPASRSSASRCASRDAADRARVARNRPNRPIAADRTVAAVPPGEDTPLVD